jgi:hypothetical protein
VKLLLGLLAVIGFFGISCFSWRRSIQLVFVLLVIEGALRKWVLPQASDLMYFLKDFVLIAAYTNFLVSERRRLVFKLSVINTLVLLLAGWCIFQIFNPSLGSPLVGLFGLRGYLLYIPLMWIVPILFQSQESLHKFLRSHLLLTIPVGLLGIAQFFSPPSSPLNIYTPGDLAVATFGVANIVRVTGTFSYISGYTIYLLICFGCLIPLLSNRQSYAWKLILIFELCLVSVNSLMTGARGLIIFEVLFLLGYLSIKVLTQPQTTLRLFKQFLPPTIIAITVATLWFQPAIDAFWLRTTSNQDLSSRVVSTLAEPIQFSAYKELDGYGPGATHQATPSLRRAFDLPAGESIPTYYEGEVGRVALELGPFGSLLWYGLRLSILWALWRVFWRLKSPLLRDLALAASLIQAIQITSFLVFHHTFSVYYWFFSSFVFLLPRLEQLENRYRAERVMRYHAPSPYLPGSSHQ